MVNPNEYDCGGWATRHDLLCADGRTIRKNAFKDNDGLVVPLIWNHDHSNQDAVLGHALLECRDEGVYAYCKFNDTDNGKHAKSCVDNGDIRSLSIYANKLKQVGSDVIHGTIRELSLVLSGANPGATIDFVMAHGDEEDDGFYADYDEAAITIYHSGINNEKEDDIMNEEKTVQDVIDSMTEEQQQVMYALIGQALGVEDDIDDEDDNIEHKKKKCVRHSEEFDNDYDEDTTIQDVIDSMDDVQQNVLYTLIGKALTDRANEEIEHSYNEGGNDTMKHNVFDSNGTPEVGVLSHSAQEEIIALAKSSSVGSLQTALSIYAEEHDELAHGFDSTNMGKLFPDFTDVNPGAPELVERDQSWVGLVMRKARKTPASRVRTRQADARVASFKAKGYTNREEEKALSANINVIMRTTDPQTVYQKDELHRDDILDITDFDLVAYNKVAMKHSLEESVALAALVGDGREIDDPDKIHEQHIRSIWHDSEVYTIHADIDIEAAREELQGTNTGANFGDNYVYAEAVIAASLYSREQYKGKGQLDFFCTPHLLNVMLLARDLNGRRIYDSKADLAKALNVGEIHTVEQFEGLTRTTDAGATKKLLGIFVNMSNYQFGCAKGGEITTFEDFDIDFNKQKYLMETRLSGALIDIASAIALEEPVTASNAAG